MQATVTTRRLQHHRIWLVAILVVLLCALAAGASVTMIRDNESPATISARPVIESKTNDNFRFAEMNALPDAAPLHIVNFDRLRFKEINELPGGDASLVAPASDRLGERH